jgi:phosphoribosylformylglycinamidine cyclo-ligase
MPGFYADGEYDIAGFIVGIVDKANLIDGRTIVAGDALIGLPSAGLHTNGYSLARRVLFDVAKYDPQTVVPELGTTVGEALLATHRSYLRALVPLISARLVKGMAHITGGGITENLPRVFPRGCGAAVDRGAWSVPPIFSLLQRRGGIDIEEMFRAFNMGIGLIVVSSGPDAPHVVARLEQEGERPVVLGEVVPGQGVRYV